MILSPNNDRQPKGSVVNYADFPQKNDGITLPPPPNFLAKLFIWIAGIKILQIIYCSVVPEYIRSVFRTKILVDSKKAKALTLIVIEYIKSSNAVIANYKKIIRVLEKNKLGVFSAELIEAFYDKKINAYIFNNVLFPKFKKSVCWEALFIDSLLFNSF
ncbi:MAG: hypothetical protein Ta2B_23070 [Termitinemataceae bacterium]|nr:MAG: hypothetical protein Ta2B_23070 [Termitinemataceae bacterium]